MNNSEIEKLGKLMEEEYNEPVENQVYLHINNGGVIFKIDETGYHNKPLLKIEAYNFGQKLNGMELNLSGEMLKQLGLWFLKNCYKYENELGASDPFRIYVNDKEIKTQFDTSDEENEAHCDGDVGCDEECSKSSDCKCMQE